MKIQKGLMTVVAMLFVFMAYGGGALADNCTDLALQPYGGATITSAAMVPANGATPAYCSVTATAEEQTDIVVWMPDNWQKRFLHLGGGGFDGITPFDPTFPPLTMEPSYGNLLQQGYALAGSNGGHQASVWPNATFGTDFNLTQDYAYVAIGTTVRVAKALIAAYYGQRPRYSYFAGCSNGGRGAFNAAAKYPFEYDGIVAGSPSRNMPGLASGWMRNLGATILTPANITAIYAAAVAACDALDGLEDGIISNPDACIQVFNPATVPGLTPADLAVVQTILSDTTLADGTVVYSRYGFGPLNWAPGYGVLGIGFVGWMVYRNPSYNPATWNLDQDYPDVVTVLEGAYDCSAKTDPLVRYANLGRKLIAWHGTDDTLLSHYDTERTFYQIADAAGEYGRSNMKLYLAAGVGHCGDTMGEPGADHFDMISAITNWVEKGIAPGNIVASKVNSAGEVLFTRPLCESPRYPQYIGGNPNDARSFQCEMPSSPYIPLVGPKVH